MSHTSYLKIRKALYVRPSMQEKVIVKKEKKISFYMSMLLKIFKAAVLREFEFFRVGLSGGVNKYL